VEKIVERSTDRLNDIARALRLSKKDLGEEPARPRPAAVPAPEPAAAASHPDAAEEARAAAAASRQTLFLHALEEIAGALAGSAPPGDVFMMILEGMYRGIGFERVLLALVTPDRAWMRGRYGLGEHASEIVASFAVPLDASGGALGRVIVGARELLVADATDAEAVAGVPRGFLDRMRAHTFFLIPLVIRGSAIGAFYVDRTAAQGPITEAEQRSLRMLVNHAVLAVTHSQAA
jgi:eukaryotic-like serine/threonine-protein kinase